MIDAMMGQIRLITGMWLAAVAEEQAAVVAPSGYRAAEC